MGASNTPLYDLIELSGIGINATYTTTPGGGGDIIGFVDTATYTDSENNNTATQITELSEFDDANAGTLTIDGVNYTFSLADPDNTNVTILYDWGASSIDLTGDSGSSEVVFIQAVPTGGGAARYFMAVDDSVGDLPNIVSIQIRSLDFSPAGNDVQINLDEDNNVTACFAEGTFIDTPRGPRRIERLKPGDEVSTLDGGPQPVLWAGHHHVTPAGMQRNPRFAPVLIPRYVLGAEDNLLVSYQHCVMLNPFAAPVHQRFARAGHLVDARGAVRVAKGRSEVVYHHILLPRHHVLRANGVLTESLYPGPIGLDTLSEASRLAVLAHLPDLLTRPVEAAYGPTARKVLRKRDLKALPPIRKTYGARKTALYHSPEYSRKPLNSAHGAAHS